MDHQPEKLTNLGLEPQCFFFLGHAGCLLPKGRQDGVQAYDFKVSEVTDRYSNMTNKTVEVAAASGG